MSLHSMKDAARATCTPSIQTARCSLCSIDKWITRPPREEAAKSSWASRPRRLVVAGAVRHYPPERSIRPAGPRSTGLEASMLFVRRRVRVPSIVCTSRACAARLGRRNSRGQPLSLPYHASDGCDAHQNVFQSSQLRFSELTVAVFQKSRVLQSDTRYQGDLQILNKSYGD
jgi:hypothetical protein